MIIDLKQAAQQVVDAFGAFGDADDFATLYALAQKMRALSTAIRQAAESEPVAYVCPTSHHAHDGSMEDGPDYLEWADEASDYEKRVGTPLYTHPAPGVPDDVVRDAERWRTFLATRPSNTHEGIIAAIDAAKTGGAA